MGSTSATADITVLSKLYFYLLLLFVTIMIRHCLCVVQEICSEPVFFTPDANLFRVNHQLMSRFNSSCTLYCFLI